MDYQRLIESGEYSKEGLTEKQRAFVEGMEYVEETLLDAFRFNELTPADGEGESTLERISHEEKDAALLEFKEYMHIAVAEQIVHFIDCDEEEEYIEEEEEDGEE